MIIPFIRERPASVLLLLRDTTKEWYISSIAKEAGLTYLHTLHILSKFYYLGLVTYKVSGRKKIVVLTEKGKNVSSKLNELLSVFSEG